MVELSDYVGREQSYVKHVFLELYLERLVYKVASNYSHVVYVDGFAGPWQSANDQFEDTSFGIALSALRRAKASWKALGRDVRMSAFLVERHSEAYEKLAEVPARYPDVEVKTYPAEFVSVLPEILRDIPATAFTFFLIDPTGWRIRLAALAPMLSRLKSEVIFNFIFEFINRAASIKDVAAELDELIPFGNWRPALEAATTPEERKAILIEAFAANLSHIGKYTYVAETTILRPVRDRPLYCLFYATRHQTGIEEFRNCQVKALKEQSRTRAKTKVRHAQAKTGQTEFFQSLHEMGPDDLTAFLDTEQDEAEKTLLILTPVEPDAIHYEELWPMVLARNAVKKTDVNQIAARLRKEGRLVFPDWEKGKRIPQPHYRVQRPGVQLPRERQS